MRRQGPGPQDRPTLAPIASTLAVVLAFASTLFNPAGANAGGTARLFEATAGADVALPRTCADDAGERAIVRDVREDATLVMSDGRIAGLVGIDLPRPSLDDGQKGRARAKAAHNFLTDLVAGEEVWLHHSGRRYDRYGRALAEIVRGRDGRWIQGTLVAAGAARVRMNADHPTCTKTLLALEKAARDRRLGNWKDLWYRTFRADDPLLLDHLGRFEIVEGRVRSVGRGRDRVYLNFGTHWTTDFTIMIPDRDLPRFRATPNDPESLRGRVVRVRGMLRSEGGPAIYGTHPDMIEIVE
ncbi:MAG: thermonuclease family protein [Hyphomicrobiales bacterium]|nr:thermonuclease family protein [Hyphomicrobiales bacterium]